MLLTFVDPPCNAPFISTSAPLRGSTFPACGSTTPCTCWGRGATLRRRRLHRDLPMKNTFRAFLKRPTDFLRHRSERNPCKTTKERCCQRGKHRSFCYSHQCKRKPSISSPSVKTARKRVIFSSLGTEKAIASLPIAAYLCSPMA